MRDFLFLSGEFRISMLLVFSKDNWDHTATSDKLVLLSDQKRFRRERYFNEERRGAIFYADMEDKELEKYNLRLLMDNHISCWPSPHLLLAMTDRHMVLRDCVDSGFVGHKIIQSNKIYKAMPYPFVMKIGNSHRGIGKHLIYTDSDLQKVSEENIGNTDTITYEPFFQGVSARILIIDKNAFGIRIDNDNWIANSPGAEVSLFEPPKVLTDHAFSVANRFGLDFAGVDYILGPQGDAHFLEINQYPGLDVDDSVTSVVKNALLNKMSYVEDIAEIMDN